MLVLVQIDLSGADLDLFDAYERQVLALLGEHATLRSKPFRFPQGTSTVSRASGSISGKSMV